MRFALAVLTLAFPLAAADFTPLDRDVDAAMKAQGVPGAAVAIVQEGRVVYAKGFGVTSIEGSTPVTGSTLFRLGSTAKIFTALSLLRLEAEGRVRLDEPISAYVAGLPPRLGRVTLQHLLSHTAGLRDDAPMDGPHDETALSANVLSYTDDMVMAEPGRVFSYANTGYTLAGLVLERVHGKPFATAVEELVLRPLGMTVSTYRPLQALTFPLALGHARDRDGAHVLRPFPDHAGSWPPGSLFSSADEMARMLSALLEGGRVEGRDGLPAAVVSKALDPRRLIPPLDMSYGYGAMIADREGRRLVFHTGGRAGFGSTFVTLPGRRLGAVVMTNASGATFRSIAERAVEIAAAQPPRTKDPTPRAAAVPMEEAEMQRYEGTYRNGPLLETELAVRDGRLHARVGTRWLPVEKVGEDSFRVPGGAQLSSFRLDREPGGQIAFLLAEAWALARVEARPTSEPQDRRSKPL